MAGPGAKPAKDVQPRLRLDKWLWSARFFKTRDLAAEVIESGHLRLNSQPCRKPGQTVRPGDVVTAATPGKVRVLRVVASGERRGPATEAQALFEDLTDPPDPATAGVDPDPGAAADE